MGLWFKNGKILYVDGAAAMDEACCCEQPCACCLGALSGATITITGVAENGFACGCAGSNDSYYVPNTGADADCVGTLSFPGVTTCGGGSVLVGWNLVSKNGLDLSEGCYLRAGIGEDVGAGGINLERLIFIDDEACIGQDFTLTAGGDPYYKVNASCDYDGVTVRVVFS